MSNQSIVLIGMMGAGKSTVGRALARHLSWEFSDTDHVIENQTGVSIPVIFEIEGEAGFRRRETQCLIDFSNKSAVVLATGGGIVLAEENRRLLKQIGPVVYLKASVQELFQRTKLDKNRPLLQTPNPRQRIEELLAKRKPLYESCADLVVETGRQPVHLIVQKICKALGLESGHPANRKVQTSE